MWIFCIGSISKCFFIHQTLVRYIAMSKIFYMKISWRPVTIWLEIFIYVCLGVRTSNIRQNVVVCFYFFSLSFISRSFLSDIDFALFTFHSGDAIEYRDLIPHSSHSYLPTSAIEANRIEKNKKNAPAIFSVLTRHGSKIAFCNLRAKSKRWNILYIGYSTLVDMGR